MAPANNDRHSAGASGHTGTIPKSKVRNNCNVPKEVVTPTRRDMASNLVTTSLDWVPVSEYNTRTSYNQSRKPTNTSDHELADLDNSGSFESGFGRFVPVRPQPRALPLNVQNRDITDHADDGNTTSNSSATLHPYGHQMQNGLIPHSNHAAAAVMIVNPTTPNAIGGTISQPFNTPNQNRNNLTRNLNPARNNLDGASASNNNSSQSLSGRTATKTVNLMNNMFDPGQGSLNNINDNSHVQRESARALGEAIVASCPDAAAVERRLGQIREYIRVTSSLVDTMRNSEDEAYIEHTKEEYDELVEMVMKLKESESKLKTILEDKGPDNEEVPAEETTITVTPQSEVLELVKDAYENTNKMNEDNVNEDKACNVKINDNGNNLKKVTNIENEQINKGLNNMKQIRDEQVKTISETQENQHASTDHLDKIDEVNDESESTKEVKECDADPVTVNKEEKDDKELNEKLRKNILSCVEKVAKIEEMKTKEDNKLGPQQEIVVRPISVQSNNSGYSENELWQNEIKNTMHSATSLQIAALNKQRRMLKYQEEAKQHLEEFVETARRRHVPDINPSTSHDNLSSNQNSSFSNYQHPSRIYPNPIGVATTLPHSSDAHQNLPGTSDQHAHRHASQHDDRFTNRDANVASSEEAAEVGRDSEGEDDERLVTDRERLLRLTSKLRDLQYKKRDMENLVSDFQKIQAGVRASSSHNTYSVGSSGDESGDDEPSRKCNKSDTNMKNEDPFKLMEIKAIKAALQKTKDLMRSVDNYETEHLSVHDDFQAQALSNMHDNKSEGGWSTEGSVCRVRNSLPSHRHKFTNEQHEQQQHHHQQQQQQHHQQQQQQQQQHQHHHQQQTQQKHDMNVASLEALTHELRLEADKIMEQRARVMDLVTTNKERGRKQKKVNEEVVRSSGGAGPAPGPAERKQMQLRALLAEKQRELEALLNKQKVLCAVEAQKMKGDSRAGSIVNHSYNSEQEEVDSRSEHIVLDSQSSRENDTFRSVTTAGGEQEAAAESAGGVRSPPAAHSLLPSAYGSDSDSASRAKSNQRNRTRRRQLQDRQSDDASAAQSSISNQNMRHETRVDSSNVNAAPPISHNVESPITMPYTQFPPPCWVNTKSNQDMRTNQFTQNSHSQTMERLMGTPQFSYPPSVPYSMMMPYGMMGGCGCGCGVWGAWCWQQIVMQQRDLHQLREQLNHLEERWRAETASHTLNNQVPPGNRANNYWDNFRSYSRQNLLSANSKTNAEGGACAPPAPHPPLAARSHNTLHRAPPTSADIPKRNCDGIPPPPPPLATAHPLSYERSLSFSSAPDVLNVNQDDSSPNPPPPAHRNLNIANPIPEIIQSHSNLNTAKRKSSTKLPAKNSSRRNFTLDYSQTSNINIASTSEAPNPNLASTTRESYDKYTSKLFDLLRENVYSEVTALIDVNESHPDFLIQLFRELQFISSEPLRQKVLQSIRAVLSPLNDTNENVSEENSLDVATNSAELANFNDAPLSSQTAADNNIVRFLLQKSEELCTPEFLETLASHIHSASEGRQSQQSKRRILQLLSKYEGMRVCDVSGDIAENLPLLISGNNEGDESTQFNSEMSESSILQDVAGSLNMFSSSDPQLHQMSACPYDLWANHVHMDIDGPDPNDEGSPRSSREGKVDLIDCTEMQNGDLAEADQTCRTEPSEAGHSGDVASSGNVAEALPDVIDTEEATPTEAEAEWFGLDRVPTRLQMADSSEKQKD